MTYLEAVDYREKNLHLVGETHEDYKVIDILIYPKDKPFWNAFMDMYSRRKVHPIETSRNIPSNNFGLMADFRHDQKTSMFKDLSEFPESFGIVLPENH